VLNLICLKLIRAFGMSERGQVLVEYGLIIALVALIGFAGVMITGGGMKAIYSVIQSAAGCLSGPSSCSP
jgi:Flp pilus assembly pilin Flp